MCHKPWGTRRWQCPCGTAWLDCPEHLNALNSQPRSTSVQQPKRLASAAMPDHVAASKLAKITATAHAHHAAVCNTRATLACDLGPRLQAKFPNLTRQQVQHALPTPQHAYPWPHASVDVVTTIADSNATSLIRQAVPGGDSAANSTFVTSDLNIGGVNTSLNM